MCNLKSTLCTKIHSNFQDHLLSGQNTTFWKLDLLPSSGKGYTYSVGFLRKRSHMKTETGPVSETWFSSYLEYRQWNRNPFILSVIHHCQTPLKSTSTFFFYLASVSQYVYNSYLLTSLLTYLLRGLSL
jgi:hypothetical protein